MYKIKIGKKYITLSPRPKETILNALYIQFNKSTSTTLPLAYTDIKEGQIRYSLLYLPKGIKIIGAYIDER